MLDLSQERMEANFCYNDAGFLIRFSYMLLDYNKTCYYFRYSNSKFGTTVRMKSLTIFSGVLHLLQHFKSDFAHLLAV